MIIEYLYLKTVHDKQSYNGVNCPVSCEDIDFLKIYFLVYACENDAIVFLNKIN